MNDDSEFSKLEREVQLLEEWLERKHGSVENYRDHVKYYERWGILSSSLIDFLRSKPLADWTDSDAALCWKVILFDYYEVSLLYHLSFDELLDLANQATVPLAKGFQLYLARVCGNIQDFKQQMQFATMLFESARSFRVQIEVFGWLAARGSAKTEEYAKRIWDSGDCEEFQQWDKQVALLVSLKPIRKQKELLDKYLAKARKSEYPSVVSCAQVITTLRDYGTKKH